MSRTIPRAYVTAAWNENPVVAKDEAVKYCSALVREGYLPLCPVLAFDGIIPVDVEDAHKRRREMSEDMLRRSRFLVICEGKGDCHDAERCGRLCLIICHGHR